MGTENTGIKLIVVASATQSEENVDRGVGETHSLRRLFSGAAKVVEVDPGKLRTDIDRCLAKMKGGVC